MAVTLEGGCRVSNLREGDPITSGTLCLWNQIGRATGAQAISLRIMEFAPGLSPGIQNGECDEILYLLDRKIYNPEGVGESSQGQAQSAPPLDRVSSVDAHPEGVRRPIKQILLFLNGHPYPVGTDTGIYLRPREILAIDNPGPHSITLISSQCPDPDRALQFIAPSLTLVADSAPPHRNPLVRLADRPSLPTADRWYRVLIDDEVGSTQVTQFVGSIPPGRAPDHFHKYEEVLFILKGEGCMWAGDTNAPIGAGSCIYLPKGQVHCVENTGTGELRLLGVFYPAGSPSVRYEA